MSNLKSDKQQYMMQIGTLERQSSVTVTYYEPDAYKEGGRYVTASCIIKRVEETDGTIVFTDKRRVRLADIYSLDGDIFNDLEE